MKSRRAVAVLAVLAGIAGFAGIPDAFAAPPTPGVSDARTAGVGNLAWIKNVYADLLGRVPTAQELATFQGALSHGTTRQQVALAVLGSAEYRAHVLGPIWTSLTGTSLPAAASQSFMSRLAGGATFEAILATIVASGEYFARAGGSDKVVAQIYVDLLGRNPSAAEKNVSAWLGEEKPRLDLATMVLASDEARAQYVKSVYLQLLRRVPVASETNASVSMLAGGARREQLVAMIVSSAEYGRR